MRWDGAVAIVTGASRGIGREVALAAAQKGARVGLIARTKADLDRVREQTGGTIAVADVCDEHQVRRAIDELTAALGACDILVNNAGAGAYGAFAQTGVEVFEQMIRVNYFSTVYAMNAVVPSMIERGRGHIVNIASIAGRIGAPFESAYSGAKFAVAGLSEAVAIELRPKGVGVSVVNPGPVKTNFFEARGAPYARTTPKPVEASVVARRVIACVERDRLDAYIPRWLGAAVLARVMLPAVYRIGAARSFKGQTG